MKNNFQADPILFRWIPIQKALIHTFSILTSTVLRSEPSKFQALHQQRARGAVLKCLQVNCTSHATLRTTVLQNLSGFSTIVKASFDVGFFLTLIYRTSKTL